MDTHRNSEQFMVRLGDGMKDRLKAEAERNNRSVTAEINARLAASFEPTRSVLPAIERLIGQYVEAEVQARLRAVASALTGEVA